MDYRLPARSFPKEIGTALYECRGCGYLTVSGVRPKGCPKCEGTELKIADLSARGPSRAEVEKC
jgi:rubrerythrin